MVNINLDVYNLLSMFICYNDIWHMRNFLIPKITHDSFKNRPEVCVSHFKGMKTVRTKTDRKYVMIKSVTNALNNNYKTTKSDIYVYILDYVSRR